MSNKVLIGPIRIPEKHKQGLTALLDGKDHLTYSDLVREAVYEYLVSRGVLIERPFYPYYQDEVKIL